MEQKLYDAAASLPETKLEFADIQNAASGKTVAAKKLPKALAAIAACLALVLCACLGTYAYAAEMEQYNEAIKFFNDNGLSTEGLSRGEIKAVYRDITTEAFTYSKTADVLTNSLLHGQIPGYEIEQVEPTPEDLKNLWTYIHVNNTPSGTDYKYRSEYKLDDELGFEIHDKSFIEKYEGDTLLWSVSLTEFWVYGYSPVSDGVIAYGETPTWDSRHPSYAWMAKIDVNGNLQWKKMLDNGFEDEYIAQILENEDGSYAVISRGDLKYICMTRYTTDGEQTLFQKNEVGNYGIRNVVRFGDGYMVQIVSYNTNEHARIVKMDSAGNITDSFSYSGEDAYYYITDMIEYNSKIYLSGYTVPKLSDEEKNAGGRYEIAAVLNYLHDNGIRSITSGALTPLVRDNYTAILLVCDPGVGVPQEFYSVKGSLGGKLALSDSGTLLWDTESITTTFYSPMTSSFTIGGTCYVFRYTFDSSGSLLSQEKTGETTDYSR